MCAMMRSVKTGAERNNFALDYEPRPRVSYLLLPFEIDVLRRAKVAGKWHAIEQFTHLALIHWHIVKEGEQQGEQAHDQDQAYPDEQYLPSTIVMAEGNKRHQRVGRQEAEDEAE
ncbi:Rhomboid family member 1 [Camponotus japonicus]